MKGSAPGRLVTPAATRSARPSSAPGPARRRGRAGAAPRWSRSSAGSRTPGGNRRGTNLRGAPRGGPLRRYSGRRRARGGTRGRSHSASVRRVWRRSRRPRRAPRTDRTRRCRRERDTGRCRPPAPHLTGSLPLPLEPLGEDLLDEPPHVRRASRPSSPPAVRWQNEGYEELDPARCGPLPLRLTRRARRKRGDDDAEPALRPGTFHRRKRDVELD
jgi:hypothetical protein